MSGKTFIWLVKQMTIEWWQEYRININQFQVLVIMGGCGQDICLYKEHEGCSFVRF